MLEITLIQNSTNDYIEIINEINSLSSDLKLYKIISNTDEFLNLSESRPIDILLMDYYTFKNVTVIDFYRLTSKLKFLIILINDLHVSDVCSIKDDKCLFTAKSNLPKVLLDIISDCKHVNFFKEDKTIRNRIIDELNYLGYNLSYNGTKYLIDCIYYLYTSVEYYEDVTIRSVYSIIAQRYKKSENAIKCDITRATNIMFCECEESKLKEYLGIYSLTKIGTKIIIQTILNKLERLEYTTKEEEYA